jgi:acyl carrier protein
MSDATLTAQIQSFLVDEFLFGEGTVEPSDDLFETGVVDSLGFLRVLAYMDRSFGVQVSMSEIVMENFNTVEKVAAYVVANRS